MTRRQFAASRRRFLLGARAQAVQGRPGKARISSGCVAFQGIVCRSCAEACAPQAIGFERLPGARSLARVDVEHCDGCGDCLRACPLGAIALHTA